MGLQHMQPRAREGSRMGSKCCGVMLGGDLTASGALGALAAVRSYVHGSLPRGPRRRLTVSTGTPEGALLARMAFCRLPEVCCVQAGCWRGTRARGTQRAQLGTPLQGAGRAPVSASKSMFQAPIKATCSRFLMATCHPEELICSR